MTDRSVDEYEVSDGETINTDSEISSEDEIMNTSDEEFINDSDLSTEYDSSDNEYIPPYKRQNLEDTESKEKVEIKFENGKWNIVVKKV